MACNARMEGMLSWAGFIWVDLSIIQYFSRSMFKKKNPRVARRGSFVTSAVIVSNWIKYKVLGRSMLVALRDTSPMCCG